MPKHLGYHPGIYTAGEEKCGSRVAQIVKADSTDATLL
jgi:hypothetical protein